MWSFIYMTLNEPLIYVSQDRPAPAESYAQSRGSQLEFPRIERALGIERGLHAARDLEARPAFVGHEMRELQADRMHVFHRSAERPGASDALRDRDVHR